MTATVDQHFFTYIYSKFFSISFFSDLSWRRRRRSGEFYLGYSRQELMNVSWYQLLHWDFMREAQSKHRLSMHSNYLFIIKKRQFNCYSIMRSYSIGTGSVVHIISETSTQEQLMALDPLRLTGQRSGRNWPTARHHLYQSDSQVRNKSSILCNSKINCCNIHAGSLN